MKLTKYLILYFILNAFFVFGQSDTTKLVKYSPSFKFTEGLYLNFAQVKENKPLLKSHIVTMVDIRDINFFEKILQNKIITYYNDYGIKQEIKTKNLWGYCRRGTLYIQIEGEFNRIPIIGSICHFVANVAVIRESAYNPYDPYSYYGSTLRQQQVTYELQQFILDFESGKIMQYNSKTLEVIFMRDAELYQEYTALRKKKKRQLKFLYLRKYNEKHPLYIPVY